MTEILKKITETGFKKQWFTWHFHIRSRGLIRSKRHRIKPENECVSLYNKVVPEASMSEVSRGAGNIP